MLRHVATKPCSFLYVLFSNPFARLFAAYTHMYIFYLLSQFVVLLVILNQRQHYRAMHVLRVLYGKRRELFQPNTDCYINSKRK